MRNALLVIATLLPLVGGVVYIRSIFKGKSLPQRMTRLLMLAITGLSFGSLLAEGDTSGIWLALASFAQAIIVWALSFRYGMGGRDRLDITCLVLCFAGIGVWLASGDALFGLCAFILADFVAVLPSLIKTIRLPHTELGLFYLLDAIAAAVILLVGPYSWQALLYPFYLLAINFAFVGIIYRVAARVRYNVASEAHNRSD